VLNNMLKDWEINLFLLYFNYIKGDYIWIKKDLR
jgi:hypothetical protein